MIDINTGVGNKLGQVDIPDKDLVNAIKQSKMNSGITVINNSEKSNENIVTLNLSDTSVLNDVNTRYNYLTTYVFSPQKEEPQVIMR